MKVTINGRVEDFLQPRLVTGTMGQGMDFGFSEFIVTAMNVGFSFVVIDFADDEVQTVLDLRSYVKGFIDGESNVRSQF